MTETPELLPCPSCNSTDLLDELITSTSGESSTRFISCNCGMSGNLKAWNTRVPYSTVVRRKLPRFIGMIGVNGDDRAVKALFDKPLAIEDHAEIAKRLIEPPSTVGESGAALVALLTWCQIERGKIIMDGYDYKSGEEYGIRRVELQIERAIASEKEGDKAGLAAIQAAADEVVSRVAEWDDRTSPEDFPEALLITPSELHRELVRFATDIGALAPPAASLIAKGEGPSKDWCMEMARLEGEAGDPDVSVGLLSDNARFLTSALPDGEAVAWPTEEIIAKEIFALIHPGDWNSELCIDERRESLETAKAILALFSPPASASATEANVVAGARAIAAARGHDPDALAPRTEMCGADNLQVPWWKVFEEEAEACLKVASPASAGVLKHADELHDLGFKAGWSGAIEECAKVADTFTCGICGTDGSAAAAIRALASGEK